MRNGTLGKTGTGKSKEHAGGKILPSGCTQVTSNIYSIEGVAVEELESMLQTNYVPKNNGHDNNNNNNIFFFKLGGPLARGYF